MGQAQAWGVTKEKAERERTKVMTKKKLQSNGLSSNRNSTLSQPELVNRPVHQKLRLIAQIALQILEETKEKWYGSYEIINLNNINELIINIKRKNETNPLCSSPSSFTSHLALAIRSTYL
jgi:hypothetical protein